MVYELLEVQKFLKRQKLPQNIINLIASPQSTKQPSPRPLYPSTNMADEMMKKQRQFVPPHNSSSSRSSQEAVALTCRPVNSLNPHDAQQGPDFIRVPCKARGVSQDHTAQNAFIDIPRDAPHGLILACSNEICYNSGRRFRYCIVCRTPAAKRNFHVRHAHGLDIRKGIRTESPVDRAPTPPHEKKRSATEHNRTISSVEMAAMAKQAIGKLSIEDKDAETQRSPPEERPPKKTRKSTCSEEQELVLSQEEIEWLELLHSRPSFGDTEETTKWFDSVIDCSLAFSQQTDIDESHNNVDNRAQPVKSSLLPDEADEILSALESPRNEAKPDYDRDNHFNYDQL